MKRTSKHQHCRRFNAMTQQLMDAVAGHDVGLATEDLDSGLLHIHQFEKAELAFHSRRKDQRRTPRVRGRALSRQRDKDAGRQAASAQFHALAVVLWLRHASLNYPSTRAVFLVSDAFDSTE